MIISLMGCSRLEPVQEDIVSVAMIPSKLADYPLSSHPLYPDPRLRESCGRSPSAVLQHRRQPYGAQSRGVDVGGEERRCTLSDPVGWRKLMGTASNDCGSSTHPPSTIQSAICFMCNRQIHFHL